MQRCTFIPAPKSDKPQSHDDKEEESREFPLPQKQDFVHVPVLLADEKENHRLLLLEKSISPNNLLSFFFLYLDVCDTSDLRLWLTSGCHFSLRLRPSEIDFPFEKDDVPSFPESAWKNARMFFFLEQHVRAISFSLRSNLSCQSIWVQVTVETIFVHHSPHYWNNYVTTCFKNGQFRFWPELRSNNFLFFAFAG